MSANFTAHDQGKTTIKPIFPSWAIHFESNFQYDFVFDFFYRRLSKSADLLKRLYRALSFILNLNKLKFEGWTYIICFERIK